MNLFSVAVLTLYLTHTAFSQENAGTNVSPSLVECYNDTLLLVRDYRLPATIATFIELIRKIEDANPSSNARELSYQILQRFRQDGIWRTAKEVDASLGLPYSPRGWESYKNKVQLAKLTPGSAVNFNNNSLNVLERCSLHSLISSTIEQNERKDEATVCNKISRYTSRIHKRQTELSERLEDPNKYARSACPIESGVIYTKWGAVKAGLVLSGIAAGLQYMSIDTSNGDIDNRYASSIAGELSEAALNEPQSSIEIGNRGGWNSTIIPKYYFLEKNDKNSLYVTDAEIRGGLDGLYLALNIEDWKSKANSIKISQILDLYYSPRGVMNSTIRACNRKLLETTLTSTDALIKETSNFNFLLDGYSTSTYTPNKDSFVTRAENSVRSFNNYIAQLNDLECSSEEVFVQRAATDILIFLDTNWEYETITNFIAYILDNIDVNKYETSYTVFSGYTGDVIVNKSRSILDFHELYNKTVRDKHAAGFDFSKAFRMTENLFKEKLNNETDLTGQSTILLLLPQKTPTSDENTVVVDRRTEVFRRYLPDLKILVVAPGSRDSYASLVNNANNDILVLSESSEDGIKAVAKTAVDWIKNTPRSVVNPRCGSSYDTEEFSSFDLEQYVEPSGINFHKISRNYFYSGNEDDKYLKIRGQGHGTLVVCTSKTDSNPRSNSTGSDCQNIISEEVSIDLNKFCSDDSCSSVYFSVQGTVSNIRCTDKNCRFPDSIKYTITMQNVGCTGGSERLFASMAIVLAFLAILRL